MAKINLPPITTGAYSNVSLNNRFQQIEDAFNDGVLWRENPPGEPNAMDNPLDMADNKILNLSDAEFDHEAVNLGQVEQIISDELAGIVSDMKRTVRAPEEIPELPNAAQRANRLLEFDNAGNPTVAAAGGPNTYPASGITITPVPTVSAVTVQGALTELAETRPQQIATIADLEALDNVEVGQHFSVGGYLAGSTLGGGDFLAVPGSAARDGVKTFVSANGVRLVRVNIDTVTPYHAGWDGTSDAHTYVQACLDHYNDVYCPSGTYTVLFNSIKIQRNGVTLRGDGESTIFVNKAGQTISVAGGVLKIAGTESNPISGSVIRKVTVDYNRDNVTHTLDPRDNECISVVWGDSCEVSECRTVNGISEGIDIDHTINSRVVFNECTNNNGHGIHISSGSSQCVIMGNRCWDNGWAAFRAGMDCYEGFNLGGPNEIPESHNNIYVGNDCWDNYINYRILGPGNVFDGNKDHGTPGVLSNLSGVVGGVRAISSGDGERAKTVWQAKTSNDQLASFTEILNPDGNARFKLCYRRSTAGVESFIIASNTDNVLFEVFAGSGFETFTAAYVPASGSLSGATYQNSTGYYVRNGKSVTFQLRLSLSEVSIGTAVGKLTITGLPVGPQVDTAASVNAMLNWDFASPPSAINARVRQSGNIELEVFNPNATTQGYVSAEDLKTGSGSFLNQVYISGSFVTG